MKFITVTPLHRVFSGGSYGWTRGTTLILNTRYLVSIAVMNEKLSQIRMKDGSTYIVPTQQITGVTE